MESINIDSIDKRALYNAFQGVGTWLADLHVQFVSQKPITVSEVSALMEHLLPDEYKTHKYNVLDAPDEACCCICQDTDQMEVSWIQLDCGHFFHDACLERNEKDPRCPLCRRSYGLFPIGVGLKFDMVGAGGRPRRLMIKPNIDMAFGDTTTWVLDITLVKKYVMLRIYIKLVTRGRTTPDFCLYMFEFRSIQTDLLEKIDHDQIWLSDICRPHTTLVDWILPNYWTYKQKGIFAEIVRYHMWSRSDPVLDALSPRTDV